MIPPNHWYRRAADVIRKARADAQAGGLSDEDTLNLVDSRYPFGERAMSPYKQWLKARRELCGDLLGLTRIPGVVDPQYWVKLLKSD